MTDTSDRTSAAEQLAAARAQQAADDAVIAAAMADGDLGGDPSIPNTPLTNNVATPATDQANAQRNLRVDEPGGIRDDDFGLNGDMADVLAQSLEERFAQQLNADTATPDPAQTSQAPAAGEDGAGGGGTGAQDAAPAPEAPAAGTPNAADQFDLNAYARDYFGTDLSHDQAQQLFGVLGRLQTATPEERRYIDDVLSGRIQQQPPTPQPQPTVGNTTQAPSPYVTPADPATLALPPRPDDEYQAQIYDTLIAPLAASQQQLLASQQAIQAEIERNTAVQQAQQQEQMAARIDAASAQWRDSAAILTQGEFDALIDRTTRSGIFPGLMQMHHGDVEAATRAALDATFWSDPQLRSKALANTASGRDPLAGTVDPTSPVAQSQQQLDAGRRALASSVAGGGGSTTSRDPSPPSTPQGRKSAMVNEIAAAMGVNQ